ncbi:hypothetical protein TH47_05635 [Thalassospira sp. MCCC 1A02803]|nr:hypothetical protein AUQ41_08125 [Thalassospira sp. MCCC 1A02898]ONH85447.1 hypothetical protein TH47_05635 [Thalassospira sp. MCCC 1A02803]
MALLVQVTLVEVTIVEEIPRLPMAEGETEQGGPGTEAGTRDPTVRMSFPRQFVLQKKNILESFQHRICCLNCLSTHQLALTLQALWSATGGRQQLRITMSR